MKKPSLALIPSGYKTGKVYSILPNDSLGDFTFSRASGTTRLNKNGLIEDVNADVPRLDYTDDGCPSLLLEPQRINLVTHSEDFSNASWTKNTVDITTADIVSPTGELNASKMTINSASSTRRIYDSVGTSFGEDYTYSLYVKKGTSEIITIRSTSSSFIATFNLSTGTLISGTGIIEDAGNGWYRIQATGAATSTIPPIEIYEIVLSTSDDVGSYIYIWGSQAEQGSYGTSHIPTNGSITTRVADLCVDGGSADLFNDDEGVLFVETKAFADLDDNRYMMISDGAFTPYTNHIIFQYRTDGNLRVYVGGLGGSNIAFIVSSIDLSENHKIAFQYKFNDNKLFIDGIEQSPYAPFVETTLSGLNNLSFALNNNVNFMWRATVKDARYYDELLTDAELTELTTL